MTAATSGRFQVLSISGGGFRGLYPAQIIARIEEEIGHPIARHFDLIAGTSIGGILAMALALEIPAKDIVTLFVKHGDDIFKKQWWSFFGILRSTYGSGTLQKLLSKEDLFGDRVLGACKHPVIVPSINYSSGKPVIFKTPHNENLRSDHRHKMVDIALATSAAPSFFPRHLFNNNQYVDGGLFANAPGLLAAHEAEFYMGQKSEDIHVLSIGTMSSRFTVNPQNNRQGGTYDWGGWNPTNMPKRLFGLSISVQESLCDFMLEQKLGARYLHVDEPLTDKKANAVALDKTDAAAREALLGAAEESAKYCIGNNEFMGFLKHQASEPCFYYGENATTAEEV